MWVRVANSSTTRHTWSTREASRPASSGAAISRRSAHRMLKSSRTADVRDSGGIPALARLDPRSEAKASSPSRAVSAGPPLDEPAEGLPSCVPDFQDSHLAVAVFRDLPDPGGECLGQEVQPPFQLVHQLTPAESIARRFKIVHSHILGSAKRGAMLVILEKATGRME